jgi:hypothetical protein
VLGETGSPAAIPALIDAIETDADYLCEIASAALLKIGTPAVQPLIDRIGELLDNPEIDEYGNKIDIIYTLDTLSEIRDPRSFDFMVELLDRFEGDDDDDDLAHLCTCFYYQHNPEIIPRLRAIAEEYRDVSGTFLNISAEAEDTIMRLGVYQVIGSEDWATCSTDGCNIFNLPSVDIDLKYRRNGEESVDRFRIMTDYHHDSGLISIGNDIMEFNIKFCTVGELIKLKEFLKGEGDYFSEGVRVFSHVSGEFDPVDTEDVGLVRVEDYVAATYNSHEFRLELVLDSAAIGTLIPVIDTQRFLLSCDSYRRLDEFYDMQEASSKIKGLIESHVSEEETPEPECEHEFELLKTHKKYAVYKCVKCGEAKKEFS